MSSHGSDHITNEKHDTSPEIVSAAVPATHTPKVQGKEKTVHNVSLWRLPILCVSLLVC
jgi:hypothetical protein